MEQGERPLDTKAKERQTLYRQKSIRNNTKYIYVTRMLERCLSCTQGSLLGTHISFLI